MDKLKILFLYNEALSNDREKVRSKELIASKSCARENYLKENSEENNVESKDVSKIKYQYF
jgi:hypothetical protein